MMLFATELDIISLKSGIAYIFSHYFAKNSLPTENILTVNNTIILIKSVINKDKNHYYCKIFFMK